MTISRDSNQSLRLAPLEQDLQRADAHDEEEQPEPVHAAVLPATLYVGSGTYDQVRYAARMPSGMLM